MEIIVVKIVFWLQVSNGENYNFKDIPKIIICFSFYLPLYYIVIPISLVSPKISSQQLHKKIPVSFCFGDMPVVYYAIKEI